MSRNNFCTFCSPKQHVISETSVCVLVSVPLTSCSDPEKYAVELPCLSPLSSQEDGSGVYSVAFIVSLLVLKLQGIVAKLPL